MSDGSFFTGLHSGGTGPGNWNPWSNAPLNGPDGQPLLGMVGDLGDTLVSGGSSITNSGTIGVPPALISGSGAGLVINVTYDQSPSSLPSGFVAAINYVVNYYESLFSTPTTVNIDVGFGEIASQSLASNALGESETFLGAYNYNTFKAALANSDPGAAASLPASQPVSGTMWVPTAESKALGLTPAQATTAIDGYAGFSSALPFTYDPNNPAVAGSYDFIGVVEHEFSEIMGRIDLFGDKIDGVNPGYTPFDMFHYTSQGVHTYTGTTTNYFSADGGHTNLDFFNSNPSGDLGDWAASAGADAYLAFSPMDQADLVSQADITAMNALGYQSAPPIVIEAFGSTSLVEAAGFYYMDPVSGGAGVSLKNSGTPVVEGSLGVWTPIGAEAITGGYDVAWKQGSNDVYAIWTTDSNGNFVSNLVGGPGSSAGIETIETTFHQDLNGDGTIGPVVTNIQTDGTTTLAEIGNDYYLNPSTGGTGPALQINGVPVAAGSLGVWHPIGAIATAGGYDVAWKQGSNDVYAVWTTDSNGNFVSNLVGGSGSSAGIETIETTFHQDLNGDGTIGPVVANIQTDGSTTLAEIGNDYYLNPSTGGTGPALQISGVPVAAGSLGVWHPIGAIATAGGYDVAWKQGSNDVYAVWTTDSNGNFVSNLTGGPGSSAGIETIETTFHQDLNGDGTIGPVVTNIQTDGTTTLAEIGNDYYLNPSTGGTGPALQINGVPVAAGSLGVWHPIGAIATAGGYDVAWKQGSNDVYAVWTTDSNGNFVSNLVSGSGSSAAIETIETTFHQDLNGDGTVGVPAGGGQLAGDHASLVAQNPLPPPTHDLS